jgi:hypothetical protein
MKLPKGFELMDNAPSQDRNQSNINLPAGFELMQDRPIGQSRPAKAFGIGAGAGAGGAIPDILNLIGSLGPLGGMVGMEAANLSKAGLSKLGTKEQAKSLGQQFNFTPENALERIAQQSGEFAGLEGLAGAGIGGTAGPVGAGIGGVSGGLHGAVSGAIYGGLKELGMPDEAALILTAVGTLSPIAFKKLWPKITKGAKAGKNLQDILNMAEREAIMSETPQSAILEKFFPTQKKPSVAALSTFETAEKILESESSFPKVQNNRIGIDVPAQIEGGKSLQGRVSEQPSAGTVISPLEFESQASGGRGFNQQIRAAAETARKEVSNAYNLAEENYKNISSIYPRLSQEIDKTIERIETSLQPNTAESQILNVLRNLRKEIGDSTMGFREVPVQRLIKTSDSISGMANYELPFTGPKDILKKVANQLDQAAIEAIEKQGGNPNLLRQANQKYQNWANRYANDDITPFLERTVNNPESLYKKLLNDPGAFRAADSALKETNRHAQFMNAVARDIAEMKMQKYIKDTDLIGSSEYRKDLRNLRSLIGGDRADKFHRALQQRGRTKFKTLAKGDIVAPTSKFPEKKSFYETKAKKKTTPEELLSKFNTRSGIKELKKTLKPNNFEKLAEAKALQIFRDGKIRSNPTGQELFNILNKEKNYEFFVEVMGKKETDDLLNVFQQLKQNEITNNIIINTIKKLGKTAGAGYAGWKFIKPVLDLL